MSRRITQVNELIQQELGKLFTRETKFPPGCLVTITKVITSRDLGQAKIFISVLPATEREKIITVLNKQAGSLQYELGDIIVLRKIPKLIFMPDLGQEKRAHIDELIDKIHKER